MKVHSELDRGGYEQIDFGSAWGSQTVEVSIEQREGASRLT
jgi:hypothetical protein